MSPCPKASSALAPGADGDPAASPGSSTPATGTSVPLPSRRDEAAANGSPTHSKPVWIVTEAIEPAAEAAGPPDAPSLLADCDKHNRPQAVCCRDLKGDDERNLVDPDIVRDVIIGLSDGLTVPFGLTAGLSSLGSSRLVIIGGLAELFSGALSMGIGGLLASEAERDHFLYMQKATRARVARSCVGQMEREVHAVLGPLGIDQTLSHRVAGALLRVEDSLAPPPSLEPFSSYGESFWRQCLRKLARKPRFSDGTMAAHEEGVAKLRWSSDVGITAFLLKFGEGMEEVPKSRLYISAATIGSSYFVGGLVPMIPYFFVDNAQTALLYSVVVMSITLLIFGAFKAYFTGAKIGPLGYFKASSSMIVVGGLAAGASWAIVKVMEKPE